MFAKRSLNALLLSAPVALAAACLALPAAGQDAGAIDGQTQFVETCAGCHAAGGEGGYGPPLTSNAFVADTAAFVSRILHGGELMPQFSHLTDEQIAAIVNFVRTVFNNNTDLIDAAFVAAAR